MVTHKKFRESLYVEYLEEASFLYEHRRNALHDLEYSLDDLAELEERFEAHIDGLVLGEELALEICRRQAVEGDFGELHGALRVFCRTDCHEDVGRLGLEVDWDDQDIATAFADALAHELPQSWAGHVEGWLRTGPVKLKGALARAAGQRRLPLGPAVYAAAQEVSDPDELLPFIDALGRLREKAAVMLCFRCMQQPRHDLARAGALAALRLAAPQALGYLRQDGSKHAWAGIPLGVAGSARDFGLLEGMLRAQPTPDGLLGVGLLGKSEGVPLLLGFLEDETLAPWAALGLHLLTGADLVEDVEVPVGLEDEETRNAKSNSTEDGGRDVPVADAGDDGGDTVKVRRISESPQTWGQWTEKDGARLDTSRRYRLGEAYSPDAALKCFQSTRLPPQTRQVIGDELCLRYGLSLTFEADGFVMSQLQQVATSADALRAAGQRFQPGRWLLNGRYA